MSLNTTTEVDPETRTKMKQESVLSSSSSSSASSTPSSSSSVSSNGAEVSETKTGRKANKSKRKRLCDECGEKEAAEKKRQRKFNWTEKNRPAFEKCQATRRHRQAVETARKQLAQELVKELVEGKTEASTLAIETLTREVKEAQKNLDEFLAQSESKQSSE